MAEIEDKLTRDERRRVEAIDLAICLNNGRSASAGKILSDAKDFDGFIKEGR